MIRAAAERDAAVAGGSSGTVVPRRATRVLPWAGTAVTATAAAGGLHLAAAATHVDAGDLVVGFFALTGLVQLATAAGVVVLVVGARGGSSCVRRAVPALALFGTAMTAALLCLYAVVHGTELLAGLLQRSAETAAGHPHGGAGSPPTGAVAQGTQTAAGPEPVSALGTATVVVELLALVGLVALIPDRLRRRVTDLLLILGVLGWVLWLTGGLG
jgi:hypothetical protein